MKSIFPTEVDSRRTLLVWLAVLPLVTAVLLGCTSVPKQLVPFRTAESEPVPSTKGQGRIVIYAPNEEGNPPLPSPR